MNKTQKIMFRDGWGEWVVRTIKGNYIGCDDHGVLDEAASRLADEYSISHDDAYKALTTPIN